MAAYPTFGNLPLIPAADLTSLASAANAGADNRLGPSPQGSGKYKGQLGMRDSGSGDHYSMVFATGPLPADVWLAVDGATKYTPV